jgi:hypothetical protein
MGLGRPFLDTRPGPTGGGSLGTDVERRPDRRRASDDDDPSGGLQEEEGSAAYSFWGLGALGGHRARPSTVAVLAVEGAVVHGFSSGRRRRGGLLHLEDGRRKVSDPPI